MVVWGMLWSVFSCVTVREGTGGCHISEQKQPRKREGEEERGWEEEEQRREEERKGGREREVR